MIVSANLGIDNQATELVETLRLSPLSSERRARAKAAYTTRRVELDTATHLLASEFAPRAGDLLLARIEAIGQHARIELACGRRSRLYVGDEVIVCYGARYAPDQFEAYLPENLEPCALVAAGGIAAKCENRHSKMKVATAILPLGLLADRNGRRLNLADWALPRPPRAANRPYTIGVVGTAMNSGKTTVAANLVRGLKQSGRRVGTAKVTGTGAGPDRWAMIDAGADVVLDFTDAGAPSTFGLSAADVEGLFTTLTGHLAASAVDVAVLEIADGLYHKETASLLASGTFSAGVDAVIFAAQDALGATAGIDLLRRQGLPVIAVSGVVTASPLAIRETERTIDLPVISTKDLMNPNGLPMEIRHRGVVVEIPVARKDDDASSATSIKEASVAATESSSLPFAKWTNDAQLSA